MHTDEELKMAATFAYVDIGPVYDELCASGETNITIERIIEYKGGPNSEFCQQNNIVPGDGCIFVKGVEIPNEYLHEWSIISTYEPTGDEYNGFFGCVIDTGNNNAIVSFRGSNDFTELSNYIYDWDRADFQLLVEQMNEQLTGQHETVEKYAEMLNANGTLNGYNIEVTGHSLGGNLGMFFTMISARYGWADNIVKCLNFDGPAFNREMINAYINEIRQMGDKIYHCQYSAVGSIFMENVESYFHVLHGDIDESKLDEEDQTKLSTPNNEISNDITLSIKTHPTKCLRTDENGMIVQTNPTNTALIISALTCEMDGIPANVQVRLLEDVNTIVYELFGFDPNDPMAKIDYRKIDFSKLPDALLNNFGATEELLTYVVISAIAVLYDHPEFIVNTFIDAVYDGLDKLNIFSPEDLAKQREFCHNLWNKVQSKVKEYHLYMATKYSNDNPVINVDTDSLREYARRIDAVNGRLADLDDRLNTLYSQVGFWDLLRLINADLITGYSWHLTKCKTYLENTANSFDDAEWQNIEMFK